MAIKLQASWPALQWCKLLYIAVVLCIVHLFIFSLEMYKTIIGFGLFFRFENNV